MAERAGVGNVKRLRRRGGDESERMGMDLHIAQRFFDQRHVAGHALAASAVQLVVRMSGNVVGERADRRVRSVTTEAKRIAFLTQHRDIIAAVRIVA